MAFCSEQSHFLPVEEGAPANGGDCGDAPAPAAPVWRKAAVAVALVALASATALAFMGWHAAVATTTSKTATAHGLIQRSAIPNIKYGSDEHGACPSGYARIVDEATCRAVMPFLPGGDPDHYNGAAKEADWPRGCYSCQSARNCEDGVWFNPHRRGGQQNGAHPICVKDFAIETGKTLFVGDSDVDYWHTFRTAVPDAYNVGIGGNTCQDALQEIDSLLAAFKPAWVVLVCGENDLAGGASVKRTFNRWTRVVKKVRNSGARVVMMGTKPEAATRNLHKKYQKYDTKIKEYVKNAAQKTAPAPVIFNDVFQAFQAMGNSDSLYDRSERPDYLHMGPAGYTHWNNWARVAQSEFLDCVIWKGGACKVKGVRGPSVVVVKATTNECPAGLEKLATKEKCHAASGLVGGTLEFQDSEDLEGWPAGCYQCQAGVDGCKAGVWFNRHATGAAKKGAHLLCTKAA